jgi:uncharacterized protein YbaA (DUF1428 family)
MTQATGIARSQGIIEIVDVILSDNPEGGIVALMRAHIAENRNLT